MFKVERGRSSASLTHLINVDVFFHVYEFSFKLHHMESNVESSTKKSSASKLVDLLLKEINQQDINGLLHIQQVL